MRNSSASSTRRRAAKRGVVMKIREDSSGQPYVEVPVGSERIRVTYVRARKAGYGVASIRIQIRDKSRHLRRGPEIPVESLGDMVGAMFCVLANAK